MDDDFLLAIQLQEQFDNEYQTSLFSSDGLNDSGFPQNSKKRKVEVTGGGSDVVPRWMPTVQPERPLSIVDETWEMLDPSPDVRAMFLEFNDTFFWGKLSGVEVKWSPRMTLCAGLCSYEGRGGLCSIRLSEPLLKLRPRKDLVQTLLHEMIHALLFVTQNNRDRDGHGPEFCKHMNRINKASGTNITIYHSFHDEVDVYRQHWWRCNGPCQSRKPYFGFVKRAMNRAPSSLDPWWGDHQRTCGGTYTKVKEPEGYSKKSQKGDQQNGKNSGKKASGNEKKPSTTTGSGSQDIRNIIPFSGKGFLLGGKSQSSTSSSPTHKPLVPLASTSFSSPISSPKKLFTPSSPAKGITSPVLSGLNRSTEIRPTSSAGQKAPVKWSVANTRVFVNINGSPVKISKPPSSICQGSDNIKQRSIQNFFGSADHRKSLSESSILNTETNRDSVTSPKSTVSATSTYSLFSQQKRSSSPSTLNTSKTSQSAYPPVLPARGSPVEPTQSRYFTDSNSAGGGVGQRKRARDDHSSSSSSSNYFQRTSNGASVASVSAKYPALQQRTASTSSSTSTASPHSPAALQSVTSSSSSSALMVSCPVCQAKVQESKINEHLDSCLS
ncbi:DNA-dependent metalloprotease SPRTN [Betta splendens]|uniref:DNA-dependent metalloprotease SPRTN n=1 Tax=Betta splendens TaxID=158456 RepID=A0A6P7LQN7_BETSP|nr:DNA-dependent metalloprotease SPRTN [Betta splendens]